jgi:ADP-ribosyl-[dinitrogen reductase] hydrolase
MDVLDNDNKIVNGILGFIIGDALGVPFEFIDRNKLNNNKVIDMVGYGVYNMPKGSWSDDSSMVIATIKAIIDNKGKINYIDIMNNFMLWNEENEFTPNNKMFDIGNTTAKALRNYKYRNEFKIYNDPIKCGIDNFNDNGNGSLMRILPIAMCCYYKKLNDNEIYNLIKDISSLTHSHQISILGCYIYSLLVIKLLSGEEKEESYKFIRDYNYSKYFNNESISVYNRLLNNDISKLDIDSISSKGYVVDSLEAVIWCFINSNDYSEGILKAVNLGNDTDTIGALVGGVSGIYYSNINNKWLNDLIRKDYLIDLCLEYRKIMENGL